MIEPFGLLFMDFNIKSPKNKIEYFFCHFVSSISKCSSVHHRLVNVCQPCGSTKWHPQLPKHLEAHDNFITLTLNQQKTSKQMNIEFFWSTGCFDYWIFLSTYCLMCSLLDCLIEIWKLNITQIYERLSGPENYPTWEHEQHDVASSWLFPGKRASNTPDERKK